MRFETKAIHAGQDPEPTYGAVNVPIYQTSTYAADGVGRSKGYDYARTGNPTRTALETCLAALEEGTHGLCFASGMAAETMLLTALKPGDHAQHPVGRVGVPDDVAAAVTYLLSEEAAFVTGAELIVDGGMTRKMIYT